MPAVYIDDAQTYRRHYAYNIHKPCVYVGLSGDDGGGCQRDAQFHTRLCEAAVRIGCSLKRHAADTSLGPA